MDRAATTSSPTSPLQRLRTISTTRAARTGMTPPAQAIRARSGFPARYRPTPAASPSRAIIKRATSKLNAALSFVSRSAGNSGMFDNFSARSKSEVAQDAVRRPAKNKIAYSRVAVTAHHQKAGAALNSVFLQGNRDIATVIEGGKRFGEKTTLLQASGETGTRIFFPKFLLVDY